jgi:hypothetical protein
MIVVAKPSKPFTYTAKNTARRQAIIVDYEEEIDALYNTLAVGAQVAAPETWDLEGCVQFVRVMVGKPIGDNADFFAHGIDRLGLSPFHEKLKTNYMAAVYKQVEFAKAF